MPEGLDNSWFDAEAKKIFGHYGIACRERLGKILHCRVGFRSKYGFHWRGHGDTEQQALDQARRTRLPDDPTPQDASWVPSSLTSPFTPYRAKEPANV